MTEPTVTSGTGVLERALDAGDGVVQLAPTWVPRVFSTPGRRLRLHPADYFAFGKDRGGIDERWIASPIRADNGPATGPYEGLSLVRGPDGELAPFDEFVRHHGAALIGPEAWRRDEGLVAFAKFFDNEQALPFHLHLRQHHAEALGKKAKPEAYYYPPQLNNHLGMHPVSFLGLRPGTTPEMLKEALGCFSAGGDNRITDLSVGYRIRLGEGWDIPAGVLHAPGSALTYEPQAASDVLCMCESWSNNRETPDDLLWKDCPESRRGDLDHLVELVDWEANTDPNFAVHRRLAPVEAWRSPSSAAQEVWIAHKSPAFSAKELTVAPGAAVEVRDRAAYGAIVVQGHGRFGAHPAEAVGTTRFGATTADEFFVGSEAAARGVRIVNHSLHEPLVVLKNFGPCNPDLPPAA